MKKFLFLLMFPGLLLARPLSLRDGALLATTASTATPIGVDLITGAETYSAESVGGAGKEAAKAADGDTTTTYWQSEGKNDTWWQAQFATATRVTRVKIYCYSGGPGSTDIKVFASNNGSSWTELWARGSGYTNLETITADFTNADSYLYYRVEFFHSNSNNSEIFEFEMFNMGP
jgi:hypothetical protein